MVMSAVALQLLLPVGRETGLGFNVTTAGREPDLGFNVTTSTTRSESTARPKLPILMLWRAFNDTHLAELARQKAAAEQRAVAAENHAAAAGACC